MKVPEIFQNRNFRLLWGGEGISLVGDQFYMIALPWLVLRLTGSPLAMGTVLALAAVPRALFMLVGGALTDRFSPRALMLTSNLMRLTLVAVLSLVTVTGVVELWMLYAFALLFGMADAFFYPAQSSIIPRLVGSEHLQTGNAVIQGTAQLSLFVGPVLAGTLISLLDGGPAGSGGSPDMVGIGAAFAIDALTFAVSAVTLGFIRSPRPVAGEEVSQPTGMLAAIAEGTRAMWNDRVLRYYFMLIGAANLLITGPFTVGIPVLAAQEYAGGAAAFGLVLSAYGAGSLSGVVLAGVRKRPSSRRFPALMLGLTALMGVSLVLLGTVKAMFPAAMVSVGMGAAQGYVVIQFSPWLQLRTPAHLLGRMMSLLMFAVVGLTPLSTLVSGALIQSGAGKVLIGAGLLMVGVIVVAALSPCVWRLGDRHPEPQPEAS
ncbi:MAG: MFS transporter [Anaerolineae bacterium]